MPGVQAGGDLENTLETVWIGTVQLRSNRPVVVSERATDISIALQFPGTPRWGDEPRGGVNP